MSQKARNRSLQVFGAVYSNVLPKKLLFSSYYITYTQATVLTLYLFAKTDDYCEVIYLLLP